MEWKKSCRCFSSQKRGKSESKNSFSIHEKQTKRRKRSKHRKIHTEGECQYLKNHEKTKNIHDNLSVIKESDTTFSSQPPLSVSKSYHTATSSMLFNELDVFNQDFQKENDRLRMFLNKLSFQNEEKISSEK